MKKNMGSLDRIIRVVLAVVFVALGLFGVVQGVWAIVLYVLAGVFLATSAVSTCPLYMPFKINTGAK
jgi:K+-transporting ATPase A subunit